MKPRSTTSGGTLSALHSAMNSGGRSMVMRFFARGMLIPLGVGARHSANATGLPQGAPSRSRVKGARSAGAKPRTLDAASTALR